jgi:hypothetical protein
MTVYDHATNNPRFRRRNGEPFDTSTDLLQLDDLFDSYTGLTPIREALAKGRLLPVDLEQMPCAFNPQVAFGALMTAHIAPAPWLGVRLGDDHLSLRTDHDPGLPRRASNEGQPRRSNGKVKLTHQELNRRRQMEGKASGSPKRDR